jgi:hypothetical protein
VKLDVQNQKSETRNILDEQELLQKKIIVFFRHFAVSRPVGWWRNLANEPISVNAFARRRHGTVNRSKNHSIHPDAKYVKCLGSRFANFPNSPNFV